MSMFRSRRTSPWLFFALAYGWSWLFWVPAALLGRYLSTSVVTALHYLGGLGPLLAAVGLTYVTQGHRGRRDYWRRVVDFGRISAGWYGVIILTVPVLTGLALLPGLVSGGTGPWFETDARLLSQPLAIVPFALFTFVFGPLPEELGWRGCALDRLQARYGALASSLALGVAWSLWHLPLFLIPGTYQNGLGVGSLRFWLFVIDLVPKSVLYTWIYNNNRRSTLSAVLFHFMGNFVGELFPLGDPAECYRVLLYVVAALAVTAIWGPRTLARRRRIPSMVGDVPPV